MHFSKITNFLLVLKKVNAQCFKKHKRRKEGSTINITAIDIKLFLEVSLYCRSNNKMLSENYYLNFPI